MLVLFLPEQPSARSFQSRVLNSLQTRCSFDASGRVRRGHRCLLEVAPPPPGNTHPPGHIAHLFPRRESVRIGLLFPQMAGDMPCPGVVAQGSLAALQLFFLVDRGALPVLLASSREPVSFFAQTNCFLFDTHGYPYDIVTSYMEPAPFFPFASPVPCCNAMNATKPFGCVFRGCIFDAKSKLTSPCTLPS